MRVNDYVCQLCKDEIGDYFFSWHGPPFSTSKIIQVCQYCGSVVKPKIVDNVAITGTCDNDVYSLAEMLEDGFSDKKRIIKSIKIIGKHLELSAKEISNKLKIEKDNVVKQVKKTNRRSK